MSWSSPYMKEPQKTWRPLESPRIYVNRFESERYSQYFFEIFRLKIIEWIKLANILIGQFKNRIICLIFIEINEILAVQSAIKITFDKKLTKTY